MFNYDVKKIRENYIRSWSKTVGTATHELASELIDEKTKINKNDKKFVKFCLIKKGLPRHIVEAYIDFIFPTLTSYVNDGIGFGMQTEQVLVHSINCFGTADAISFKKNKLRIHDLKTGITPAHMEQLIIYAALFCLEYDIAPGEIDIELRLYQADEIILLEPTIEDITHIIDVILTLDNEVESMKDGDI
jgi:hypothetical protein